MAALFSVVANWKQTEGSSTIDDKPSYLAESANFGPRAKYGLLSVFISHSS